MIETFKQNLKIKTFKKPKILNKKMPKNPNLILDRLRKTLCSKLDLDINHSQHSRITKTKKNPRAGTINVKITPLHSAINLLIKKFYIKEGFTIPKQKKQVQQNLFYVKNSVDEYLIMTQQGDYEHIIYIFDGKLIKKPNRQA